MTTRGAPTAAPHADRTTIAGIACILAACIFLQRLALPVGGAQVPLPFFAGYGVLAVLLILGRLVIQPVLLLLFIAAFTAATLALLYSAATSSLTSYLLLVSIYVLYMFKLRYRDAGYEEVLEIYQRLMIVAAVLGIVQFAAQFAVGPDLAFPLDTYLPEIILADGFNVMVPLTYGTAVLRSNGVVFLEPSFFSQFLGLAILIELLHGQRMIRLGLYAAALVVSYSGTGIALVLLFVPFIFLRRGSIALFGWFAFGAVVLLITASALQLELLTGRVEEFSAPGSSGFARFVSPFFLIRDFLFDSPGTFLFGMGAGSIEGVMSRASLRAYLAHDPTWIKLLFEYGMLTAIPFFTYVFLGLLRDSRERTIAVAMVFTYLFLGGYLLNGTMHFLFAALAAWYSRTAPARERATMRRRVDYPGTMLAR